MGGEPQEQEEVIKVGRAMPSEHAAEINHRTVEGTEVRLAGFIADPEDPQNLLATRYTLDLQAGETSVEHGRIKRKPILEAAHYVWEHKKSASAIVSVTVSVAIGTLWVRHRKKS